MRISSCRLGLISALFLISTFAGSADGDLKAARDHQDLPATDKVIAQLKQTGDSKSGEAQYQLAKAYSYAAEIAYELHDKRRSENYAESGYEAAQRAVAVNGSNAEYHRLLGALCAQVIPANPIIGALKYGSCAKEEINKAISIDNKLALAYVSRGVGNYYLPEQMGGGVDLALKDIDKGIALDPKSAEAYLWKGVVLRKANRNAEARTAFQEALALDPQRVWAKQQLDKTPPR